MNSKLEQLNAEIRYTNWTAFKQTSQVADGARASEAFMELTAWFSEQGGELRGAYDIRGFRADSDLLFWSHAASAELIQEFLGKFRFSLLGTNFNPFWSGMGLHRPAEFNRSHVPGFMLGQTARQWLTIYPFVRSYEWYLLPEAERREMLMEHGQKGHKFSSVISNTVAAFALGDYEWLLALESDELHDLVDMMRDLRYTQARLHVREEVPFFTGKTINPSQIGATFK